MAAFGTKFVEFKEEVLPKLIPAVIPEYWYPKKDEEVDPDEGSDDEQNPKDGE